MYKNGKPNYNEIVFDEIQEEDIIKSYLGGESSVSIGKRYNTTHKPILKVLHRYNVNVTNKLSVRTYTLDEHYFDSIDTPNKAYILGFLYADGSIHRQKSTLSISLEEGDKYILQRMKEEMNSERPLEFIDYSKKHDFGYNYKNQYRFAVFSSYMCDVLISKGLVENKSWLLEFPDWLDEALLRHFVRGYFDGNGSYCPHVTKDGKFQPLITFTSTDNFCRALRLKLQNELSIPCGNVYDASCHNGVTRVLSFSGRNQVKVFLDWLYTDKDMYLIRKYEKYIQSYNIDDSLLA